MTDSDTLFAAPLARISDFAFDHEVVRVFPDMIKRSVPGYPTIIETIGLIAGQYAKPDSVIYDLGCSLGAATQSMRRHVRASGCQILAIDNSAPMIERCEEYLQAQNSMVEELTPADVIQADITQLALQSCSVVVLNFTLQFVAPALRLALLKRIYDALLPGGLLILSEKLAFADTHTQLTMEAMHHVFKRANGYSELEIAQKRSAIEKVMLPDTLETHRDRLTSAGFDHSHIWFQSLNFCSMMAYK